MAYNTPESVADYLSRFQMQVTERTKGTFSPMHVKYFLALKCPCIRRNARPRLRDGRVRG